MSLKLMYITNNPQVALIAQKYGVDRIWVDLETLGKEERQGNLNTVKSHHHIDDIKRIAPLLIGSEMLVRVNPINPQSEREINQVIDAGADIIMLPMWKTVSEVKDFIQFVGGRTKTTLLLETREAVKCLNEVLKIGGFDEIHIGLNDLHISYGLNFMFELLTNGVVETLCDKIRQAEIPYGFGGIAKLGEGLLPAEKVIMEHYRLGSTRAILSRSFCNTEEMTNITEIELAFQKNMTALRNFEGRIEYASENAHLQNRAEVVVCVDKISSLMKLRK